MPDLFDLASERETLERELLIDATRARNPSGESLHNCGDCGDEIPAGRRRALPGVRTCIYCQQDRERRGTA